MNNFVSAIGVGRHLVAVDWLEIRLQPNQRLVRSIGLLYVDLPLFRSRCADRQRSFEQSEHKLCCMLPLGPEYPLALATVDVQ